METRPMNKGELIGAFKNNWRRRFVKIFADDADAGMVFTEGPSFDDDGKVIYTHEPKTDFARYIGKFNGVCD